MDFLTLITICWFIFILYWFTSAFSAKRTLSGNYRSSFWIRIGAIVVIIFFVKVFGIHIDYHYQPNEILGWIGVLFTALGIAFAIWARMHLASNWGMPMSVKENPDLVTTGPYAYVRHPIYTGILFAMVGSVLVSGWFWGVIFIFAAAYFIYSALQEEKLMRKEFPDQYPAYIEHSKMLIPFIF